MSDVRRSRSWQILRHFWRGGQSLLAVVFHPLGRFCGRLLKNLQTPERFDNGLVLVLPGIEGESLINHNIARGLADGGVSAAIEIFDWTTGVILFFLYHLRARRRHARQVERLVQRILSYQDAYPSRPVHLVGHSGGGAMIILALEKLPLGHQITSAVLLQSALSPDRDLTTALSRTERGIWNFCSRLDVFFLGIGTLACGTLDGRHRAASGMVGFRVPSNLPLEGKELYRTRLHQVAYQLRMVSDFHFGGHLSVASRPFIANTVAPLLLAAEKPEGPRE